MNVAVGTRIGIGYQHYSGNLFAMMIWNIIKGLVLGLFLCVIGSYLWYLCTSSHIKMISVEKCETAAGQSLKELSKLVKTSWFNRKHNDVEVFSDGPCMFYMYYKKPGALYFGSERMSGYSVGVGMTEAELHQFADTISLDMDYQKMLDLLYARARTKPAPPHQF